MTTPDNSAPTLGELFAGVGGFSIGFERAGFDTVWQVEWDWHCQSVLRRHWRRAALYSDVAEINGWAIEPADVITFGSPCQDLSLAGQKAGLTGDRSSMFFEATRVIKEMQDATKRKFPRAVIWENVTGALSSNDGQDFLAVLGALADLGCYHLEWHVLDAQWFGVPQRRRRVFVIAVFDPAAARKCGRQILPVAASGKRPAQTDAEIQKGNVSARFAKGSRQESSGADVEEPVRRYNKSGTLSFGWQESYYAGVTYHEIVNTLTTSKTPAVFNKNTLRKMTPLECERAMGFPDEYTRFRFDGTEQSDERRYAQCGNGVAAPVAHWIAGYLRRILT